jgi:hypothetical protein
MGGPAAAVERVLGSFLPGMPEKGQRASAASAVGMPRLPRNASLAPRAFVTTHLAFCADGANWLARSRRYALEKNDGRTKRHRIFQIAGSFAKAWAMIVMRHA